MSVLATYSLGRAVDFILYLYEKENEETLWEMWLSKDVEENFSDFKKKNLKTLRVSEKEVISADKAQENLDFAAQFFNFSGKEGKNGSI